MSRNIKLSRNNCVADSDNVVITRNCIDCRSQRTVLFLVTIRLLFLKDLLVSCYPLTSSTTFRLSPTVTDAIFELVIHGRRLISTPRWGSR